LPPFIAPVKVAILPLSTDKTLLPPAQDLVKSFVGLNLTPRLDDSGVGIGKKNMHVLMNWEFLSVSLLISNL